MYLEIISIYLEGLLYLKIKLRVTISCQNYRFLLKSKWGEIQIDRSVWK